MVAEAAPETPVVAEVEPNPVPQTEPSSEPLSEQPPAQAPEAEPVSTPEPTEQDHLNAYLEARQKFDAGETDKLEVTRDQANAFGRYQQAEESRAVQRQQTQERFDKYIADLDGMHDTAETSILASIEKRLGFSLDASDPATELLLGEVKAHIAGLKDKSLQHAFEPTLNRERRVLAATLTQHAGWPQRQAEEFAAQFGLRATDENSPNIFGAFYQAGVATGRKLGPQEGSRVYSDSEIARIEAKARTDGQESVKLGENAPPRIGNTTTTEPITYRTKAEARTLHVQGKLSHDQMRSIERSDLPEGLGV